MIPRRAFCIWNGTEEDLPWLRRLGLETFRKYNPDVPVQVINISGSVGPIGPVSDLRRYYELHKTGGLYFDTDIVFIRGVPDAVWESDLAITMDPSVSVTHWSVEPNPDQPGFVNIGFMGAAPRHPFFGYVLDQAQKRATTPSRGYQNLGVNLLSNIFWAKHEPQIIEEYGPFLNVPLDMVLPIRWLDLHKLYNGTPFDPPDDCIGVHWYGASKQAIDYQQRMSLETLDCHPCYLQKAIKRATE
jgi:glycosyl transferase-like sugar-binding protein